MVHHPVSDHRVVKAPDELADVSMVVTRVAFHRCMNRPTSDAFAA